jgi:hypothetical protein
MGPLYRAPTMGSVVSVNTFLRFYLDDRNSRLYSVRVFCESVLRSPRANGAKIQRVECYIRTTGVPHRFLIFQILRDDSREFYLRVDRRRDKQVRMGEFILDLGESPAVDTVSVQSADSSFT